MIFQFVGSRALSSSIIKLKGGGPYSHVDLVMPSGNLLGARSDRVGGKQPGVQIRAPDYENWEKIARITISASDALGYVFAHCQVGKPYDKMAILGFIFNRNWREEDSWICSELAISIAEKAGVFEFPLMLNANKIDPCMAFAILSTYGRTEIIK